MIDISLIMFQDYPKIFNYRYTSLVFMDVNKITTLLYVPMYVKN